MVYNAMKLFMEVNPTLFDDCSQQYADDSQTHLVRQQTRESRWERLTQIAQERQRESGAMNNSGGDARDSTSRPDGPANRVNEDSSLPSPGAGLDLHDPMEKHLRGFNSLRIADEATGPPPPPAGVPSGSRESAGR